jgi:hypothetical protein
MTQDHHFGRRLADSGAAGVLESIERADTENHG